MKLRKDYYQKKFINNLFGKKIKEYKVRKRFWLFRHKKIYLPLLGIIIIGLIYLLFYSTVFRVEEIEMQGLRDISFDELEQMIQEQQSKKRFFICPQTNLFCFSKKKLGERLNSKYSLEIVVVKKRPFHKLKVYLQEHTSALTWISGDKFYYIDLQGMLLSEVPFKDPNPNFPRIYDESSQIVRGDYAILSTQQIDFIIAILTKLPLRTGDIEVNSFRLPNKNSNEIKVVTEKGWQIYFNTNLDVEKQMDKLVLIYEKKIKELGITNLEYIDLRFGNRVFYK